MGVYSRFGGKDGLLEAVFVQGFERLHAQISAASGPDALARLRNGCLAYRAFAVAHPHHYDLMFGQMLQLELAPESLERAEQTFSQLVARVADAMAAGLLAPGDDVDVAQQVWNALHGGVSLELVGVSFSSDPERTFAAMIDGLLRGLAATVVGQRGARASHEATTRPTSMHSGTCAASASPARARSARRRAPTSLPRAACVRAAPHWASARQAGRSAAGQARHRASNTSCAWNGRSSSR